MNPLVSVLMSVRNEQQWLAAAIKSVLSQSYQNFELFIVDDGSTDATSEIIKKHAATDNRIRCISHIESVGLANSLNEMIEKSNGQYIARLDGDDIARSDRLERQVSFLNDNPEVGIVGSFCREIDFEGNVVGIWERPTSDSNIRKALLKYNPFLHSSVMLRREVFDIVGTYNPQCIYAQDVELWLRIGRQFKYAILPETLIDFRVDWDKLNRKNKMARKVKLKIMMDHFRTASLPVWYRIYLVRHLILYLIPTPVMIPLKRIQRWLRGLKKQNYPMEQK